MSSKDSNTWLPSNLRSLGPSLLGKDNELVSLFYEHSSGLEIYANVFYSLIILTLGNDIAPITI
jgi:hypothetical protein